MTYLAGFTSTGSKMPSLLFGDHLDDMPLRMTRSAGASLWSEDGHEYLDLVMALGAVGLGYGHPEVTAAVIDAVQRGGIGSLAPAAEEELAAELAAMIPALEQVRFLKTGAEAVAAAVRLARTATGRDEVLTCGYHGWLDWCSVSPGVPENIRSLRHELPFNDPERTAALIRRHGNRLACVVVEPVIEAEPSPEWLRTLRDETRAVGALLIFDEIKTAFRVHLGGGAARWGGDPDLMVLGKALANGFPLAAVGGRAAVMQSVRDTWISSTMATEFVAIAAAHATIRAAARKDLPAHLGRTGTRLLAGFNRLAEAYSDLGLQARGIAEMCHLHSSDETIGPRLARGCARRGLLLKRNAYNFVSLAHRDTDIDRALGIVEDTLAAIRTTGGEP